MEVRSQNSRLKLQRKSVRGFKGRKRRAAERTIEQWERMEISSFLAGERLQYPLYLR